MHYLKQMLDGILYCHSNRVIHRDLKPQNLLIDSNGNLKIADFGLARSFTVPLPSLTHEVVTLWYRPPEIIMGQKIYTPSIDIWSIGCIFAEMITRKPLFPADSEIEMLFKIFNLLGTPDEEVWPGVTHLPNYKPTFPQFRGTGMDDIVQNDTQKQLLGLMLRMDPLARYSAYEILNHEIFTGNKSVKQNKAFVEIFNDY